VLNVISLGLGGVETTVMNYYRHIDHTKVQFDFFLQCRKRKKNPKYYEKEAVLLGANVYRRPLNKYLFPMGAFGFVRLLKQNPEIKIVHVHHQVSVYPTIVLLLSQLAGVQVRIAYSSNDERAKKRILHRLFRPLLCKTATHLAACSEDAASSMFGEKAGDEVIIIPRARDLSVYRYDLEKRNSMRKSLELGDNFVVVNVGRTVKQKNQNFLLEAFSRALEQNPNMILIIVGDGKLLMELKERAAALGLGGKVRLLGRRDDVPDLLQAADLFAFPSLHEGLGAAVIEAQAAGLPCLIADTVPKEAKVTDLAEFLPIGKGVDIWTERILSYLSFERKDTMDDVRQAGYDIHDSVKWLEELYINAVNESGCR
jgi:glycosyltransferase involved in cell wall biosynthesis